MSNRMLRPWVNSDKVNSLSPHAERLFTRLIMVVDDYGCFYADTRLLKANLFPLLLDSIREADLIRWMAECQKAGLVVLYESDGRKYLQIIEFGQRLRAKKSKFPLPDSNVRSHDSDPPPEGEYEVEEEVEGKLNRTDSDKKVFNEKKIEVGLVKGGGRFCAGDFSSLPDMKLQAARQLLKISKGLDATDDQLIGLWEIFKVQNLEGEKWYNSKNEVYSHFINWIKNQKVNGSKTITHSVKTAGGYDLLEKIRLATGGKPAD